MASFFNLDQMEDFDTYGEHLFGLGRRLVYFSTDLPLEEQKESLETKISSSEKTGSEARPEDHSPPPIFADSQFQTSFMKEHDFILQKYVRINKSLFLKQGDLFKAPNEHSQQLFLTDALALLQSQIQTFAGTKITNAISGLFQHDRVTSFISQILQKFDQKVSLSLLKMAVLVWMEYSKLNAKNLGEREIIEFSSRLLSSSFLRKLRELLPTSRQHVDLSKLKSFANVFMNTFLFIAFEYFMNPYYQLEEELIMKDYQNYQLFLYDASLNDQEGDDEEYEELKGRKLMKMTSFAQFE